MSNVFNCCNFELKCVVLSIGFDSIRFWLLDLIVVILLGELRGVEFKKCVRFGGFSNL